MSQETVLPYYPDDSKEISYQLPTREPTSLEMMFRSCRLGIEEAKDTVDHVITTGKAHTEGALLQLRDEENLPARAAMIGGLGTIGLVIGTLRGRRIKKLFYTSLGVGAGVGVCYPQESQEVVQSVKNLVQHGELPEVHLPSDIQSVINPGDVTEMLQTAINKCSDLFNTIYDYLQTSSKQPAIANVEVEKKKETQKAPSLDQKSVVFMPVKDLKPETKFEGDPGMSKVEDQDMYTTRG